MRHELKVLMTGATSVGKTTILKQARIPNVIYMDEVVKKIFYCQSHPFNQAVIREFGLSILTDGKINFAKIGKIVWSDQEAYNKINLLVQPHVFSYIQSLSGNWIFEMAGYMNWPDAYSPLFDYIIWVQNRQPSLANKFEYMGLQKKPPIITKREIACDLIINHSFGDKADIVLDAFLTSINFY